MNERIKKARKALNLTQQEFANRIGSVQNTITGYETGRRIPSNQVITLMCREFNISEEWLRTGKGEMFAQRSEEDELKRAIESMLHGRNPNFKRRLITVLASLDDEDWQVLEEKVLELAEAAKPEVVPTLAVLPIDSAHEKIELQADEFAAVAREQFISEKKQESRVSSAKESGAV